MSMSPARATTPACWCYRSLQVGGGRSVGVHVWTMCSPVRRSRIPSACMCRDRERRGRECGFRELTVTESHAGSFNTCNVHTSSTPFTTTGAAQSLGAGAILVNPWNITDMAQVWTHPTIRVWYGFLARFEIHNSRALVSFTVGRMLKGIPCSPLALGSAFPPFRSSHDRATDLQSIDGPPLLPPPARPLRTP